MEIEPETEVVATLPPAPASSVGWKSEVEPARRANLAAALGTGAAACATAGDRCSAVACPPTGRDRLFNPPDPQDARVGLGAASPGLWCEAARTGDRATGSMMKENTSTRAKNR